MSLNLCSCLSVWSPQIPRPWTFLPPRPLPTISICRMQNFVLDTHGTGDSTLEGTTYGNNKLKNQILNFLEYSSLLFRDLHEYLVSSGLIG